MEAETPPNIASEEIDVRIARIYRRADGIICVEAKDDVDITLKDLNENRDAILSLALGERVSILFLTGSGSTATEEVQREWVSKREDVIVLAEAVVAKSLAHKLVVNFLMNFYDISRPMKMFTDEEKAIRWLKRRMERENLN